MGGIARPSDRPVFLAFLEAPAGLPPTYPRFGRPKKAVAANGGKERAATYIGYPIWALWLGRHLLRMAGGSSVSRRVATTN